MITSTFNPSLVIVDLLNSKIIPLISRKAGGYPSASNILIWSCQDAKSPSLHKFKLLSEGFRLLKKTTSPFCFCGEILSLIIS